MKTATPLPFWPCPHRCETWCRSDVPLLNGLPNCTNHHPRCEHVNASLIPAFRVHEHGNIFGFIVEKEADARAMLVGEESETPLEITPIQIHREILEGLPEFAGF